MEQTQNKFSLWLEKLQQESWQLELLISGFLLSLLLSASTMLEEMLEKNTELLNGGGSGGSAYFAILILFFTSNILIINLVCHIVLRSLWIGAIGLRNISGEITIDNLRLSPTFHQYFEQKLPSFDTFIERLEKFCCLIFAFTFLIIFAIFSLFLGIVAITAFSTLVVEGAAFFHIASKGLKYVLLAILAIFGLAGLVYAIDFLSLGKIKRIQWLSRFYLPIYRFFGVISLAGVYRPLYYNMIDNPLGRKVMLAVIPYLAVLIIYSSTTYNGIAIFPRKEHFYKIADENYESLRDGYERFDEISLSQKYYDDDDFLEIFLPLITMRKMAFKPCYGQFDTEKIGFLTMGEFNAAYSDEEIEKERQKKLTQDNQDSVKNIQKQLNFEHITCVSSHFDIFISDTLQKKVTYDFYQHPKNKQKGILATVDIVALPRGKHFLDFKIKDSTNRIVQRYSVPFWKK